MIRLIGLFCDFILNSTELIMQNIIPKSSVFNEQLLIRQLKESSRLIQSKSDLDPLLQLVGDSRIVMLG